MWAFAPFAPWRTVIDHPRWWAIVIATRTFIATMFSPPAWIAPATAVPIVTAIIAIADMQRKPRHIHTDGHVRMAH
ncbi:hypothetical protein D3C78_1830300 [compost metagenome]